jgi:hypothetical protein
VLHGHDVVADETWGGDGTVHVIPSDIAVRPGATLTLEPCAIVQVGPRSTLAVFGDTATNRPARLIARGTATQPVTISRADDREGWTALRTSDGASFLDLSYTTIEGGGTTSSPMVKLIGNGDGQNLELNPTLRAISLTLRGATNCALSLQSGAAFTADSTSVAITGGGSPSPSENQNGDLQITPQALNTLPPMVAIHDNQQDRILVSAFGHILQIERDTRLRNHGVPYDFYFDSVRVHSRTAIPKLTIEAGVHLLFSSTLMIGRVSGWRWPMARGSRMRASRTREAVLPLAPRTADHRIRAMMRDCSSGPTFHRPAISPMWPSWTARATASTRPGETRR